MGSRSCDVHDRMVFGSDLDDKMWMVVFLDSSDSTYVHEVLCREF